MPSWAAGEWDRLGALELNLAVVRGAIPDLTALDGALRGSAVHAPTPPMPWPSRP